MLTMLSAKANVDPLDKSMFTVGSVPPTLVRSPLIAPPVISSVSPRSEKMIACLPPLIRPPASVILVGPSSSVKLMPISVPEIVPVLRMLRPFAHRTR